MWKTQYTNLSKFIEFWSDKHKVFVSRQKIVYFSGIQKPKIFVVVKLCFTNIRKSLIFDAPNIKCLSAAKPSVLQAVKTVSFDVAKNEVFCMLSKFYLRARKKMLISSKLLKHFLFHLNYQIIYKTKSFSKKFKIYIHLGHNSFLNSVISRTVSMEPTRFPSRSHSGDAFTDT